MSFYDEFLKSLEEDNENLESATEGLEAEETPVKEPEVTADENEEPEVPADDVPAEENVDTEVDEEAVTMESYLEQIAPITELMIMEADRIFEQRAEGLIAEEAFIEQIDELLRSYGNIEEDFAVESVWPFGKKKLEKARQEALSSGSIDRNDAERIYNQFRKDFATWTKNRAQIDSLLNQEATIPDEVKFSGSDTKKNLGTAAIKAMHEIKQVLIGFKHKGGKRVTRDSYNTLYNTAKGYAGNKNGTIKALMDGSLTKKDLDYTIADLRLVSEGAVRAQAKLDAAKAAKAKREQAVYDKERAAQEKRVAKADLKGRLANNKEARAEDRARDAAYKHENRLQEKMMKDQLRAMKKENRAKEKMSRNFTRSKYADEKAYIKGHATASWTGIAGLESYEELWETCPELAMAFESYIAECFIAEEAAELVMDEFEEALESGLYADVEDTDDEAEETPVEEPEVPAEESEEELSEDEIATVAEEAHLTAPNAIKDADECREAIKLMQKLINNLQSEIEDLRDMNDYEVNTYAIPAITKSIQKKQASLKAYKARLEVLTGPATASATENVNDDETAAVESVEREVSDEEMLTSGMESILFLEALRATCASEDEYKQIITENATELQLYGVVDPVAIARESWSEDDEEVDEEVATEAKNIVRLNKQARVNTEVARMSIGLAKKANDPLYKAYHKHSVLKRKFRDKIYAKYNSRATPLARKAVANGRNRAAMINSPAGAGIVSKIDSRLKQLDKSARNMSAIKKDLAPSKPSMGRMNK